MSKKIPPLQNSVLSAKKPKWIQLHSASSDAAQIDASTHLLVGPLQQPLNLLENENNKKAAATGDWENFLSFSTQYARERARETFLSRHRVYII